MEIVRKTKRKRKEDKTELNQVTILPEEKRRRCKTKFRLDDNAEDRQTEKVDPLRQLDQLDQNKTTSLSTAVARPVDEM